MIAERSSFLDLPRSETTRLSSVNMWRDAEAAQKAGTLVRREL
jgi:hypothetical protein